MGGAYIFGGAIEDIFCTGQGDQAGCILGDGGGEGFLQGVAISLALLFEGEIRTMAIAIDNINPMVTIGCDAGNLRRVIKDAFFGKKARIDMGRGNDFELRVCVFDRVHEFLGGFLRQGVGFPARTAAQAENKADRVWVWIVFMGFADAKMGNGGGVNQERADLLVAPDKG